MESKNIKGIKKIEGLKLKLAKVTEKLRNNIDDDSKKTKKLLQEYIKIQEQIELEKEKIETEKRREQEKKIEIQKEIINEQQEMIDEIVLDKDEVIEEFERKQEKINEKIGKLEYEREECLQTLNAIKEEELEAAKELEKAKQSDDVQAMVDAKQKIEQLKQQKEKVDKKFSRNKARLTINMLIKIVRSESEIKKIKENIEQYNEDALDYGLKPVDLDEFLKKHNVENQLISIRKDKQNDYYMDKFQESIKASLNEEGVEHKNVKKLNNKRRKEIELESEQRLKDKRDKSLPVRAIKAVGRGAARTAGTIVGVAILAGKFIGRNVERLWKNIRKSTNKTLSGANKLMLDGTTKLREKLEEDAKTFEARREKLTSAIKSPVDEEKAIESSAEKNESEKTEQTMEHDE